MILNKLDETRWGRALQVFVVVFSLLGCMIPWFFVFITKNPVWAALLIAAAVGAFSWGVLLVVGLLLFAMIYFPYMYIKYGPSNSTGPG